MGINKKVAPSADRNKRNIRQVLLGALTNQVTILEVGAGTGQHAAFFALALPNCNWVPSDLKENLASIDAWAASSGANNISPAIELNLEKEIWPTGNVDAVVCINTVHIVSWELVENLFVGAGRTLNPGGILFVYGPYEYDDRPLEPSNVEFNNWLHNRDPKSGIRKFSDVDALAKENGLILSDDRAMPAKNRSIWWQKSE